jgi:GxxExxY protein
MNQMKRIKADEGLKGETALTESIIGAAFTVSNALGCGFLERVYENALAIELRLKGHIVEQQAAREVHYRGQLVGLYQADLIVDDKVVVELKAGRSLEQAHRAQCMNYLRATGKSLGLVINFGTPRIDVHRVQSFARPIRFHPLHPLHPCPEV